MPRLLLTCEHGGNLVPEEFRPLFAGKRRLLDSHRGWDPGALELAGHLASALQAPLRFAFVSRLVVDLNRSLGSPSLFSGPVSRLPPGDLELILARHYEPYRREVERAIAQLVRERPVGPVVHVSVHTFTPVRKGVRRDVDIGVLFDPQRRLESRFVAALEDALQAECPRLRVRRNRPYKGTDDGLTTHLRTRFADRSYAGIELEVNQRFPRGADDRGRAQWRLIQSAIARALDAALAAMAGSPPRLPELPRR